MKLQEKEIVKNKTVHKNLSRKQKRLTKVGSATVIFDVFLGGKGSNFSISVVHIE